MGLRPQLRLKRTAFVLVLPLILIVSIPNRAHAYDNDTHFWLTYYLAFKVGYTPVQAAQIASANISVDFDTHTTPVLPNPNFKSDVLRPRTYIQNVRIYLHALPLRSSCITEIGVASEIEINNRALDPRVAKDPTVLVCLEKEVAKNQSYRWAEVLKYRDNPGVFLHYLQDKYAHRGFWSAVGHAGYEYVDYIGSSPEKDKSMIVDTVNYLIEFKRVMAGSPAGTTDVIAQNWQRLDAETWVDIDQTLAQLREANPSTGIEETALLKQWVQNEGKFKLSILKRIYERWKDIRRPDSAKAREIMKKQLKLEESQMPLIWSYDLRQGGFPIKDTETYRTSKMFEYRAVNVNENLKEKDAKNSNGKKLCLPWKVRAEVLTVPLCK